MMLSVLLQCFLHVCMFYKGLKTWKASTGTGPGVSMREDTMSDAKRIQQMSEKKLKKTIRMRYLLILNGSLLHQTFINICLFGLFLCSNSQFGLRDLKFFRTSKPDPVTLPRTDRSCQEALKTGKKAALIDSDTQVSLKMEGQE